MSWVFQESDPMGGAAGEAYANTLKSPGMQPEHVLAREAIQNSVDAGLEGEKVRVCFRHVLLTGAAKAAFVDAAGLADMTPRVSHLELASPNCFSALDKPRTPLSLLYVEDHHAEGLSGDPHEKGSNFYRLLLSLGDRSKSRTSKGTGGSYGFGKSVYSSSSAIQTIFAYTRFVGDDDLEHTRVFGCAYFASHEYRGANYSGRAWLGTKRHEDKAGRLVIDPYEDKQADKLAEKLGFQIREEGSRGTTILIIDATVSLSDIVVGVEDWWWPRLVANRLDVEIFDPSGSLSVPRPKKNDQLKPFIEAFEVARGIAAPKQGSQALRPLNRLGEITLGTCGFVVAPLNDQGNPIVRPDRYNTIALIRAPLMVVSYKACSETAPVVVGAFMATEEVDAILKKSEPPAHDRWDPDSANLRDVKGEAKSVVTAVMSRIRDNLRRFQREAAPPAPAKQKRLSILERALGSYFRPQGMGPKAPPGPTDSPLHLIFTKQPHAIPTDDGMLKLRSVFDIYLDQQATEDQVKLQLRISCPVMEDEGQEGDDLALTVKFHGVEAETDPTDPWLYRFLMKKGEKAHFAIESENYDPAWTVRLRPEIDAEVVQ